MMLKLKLVKKYKRLGSTWFISQVGLELNIKFDSEIQNKYIIKSILSLLSSLFGLDEYSQCPVT